LVGIVPFNLTKSSYVIKQGNCKSWILCGSTLMEQVKTIGATPKRITDLNFHHLVLFLKEI
jgi:hypothetical protein